MFFDFLNIYKIDLDLDIKRERLENIKKTFSNRVNSILVIKKKNYLFI